MRELRWSEQFIQGVTVSHATTPVGTERKIVTELPGPKSQAMHERRKATVSHGLTQGFPVYIERAEGSIH